MPKCKITPRRSADQSKNVLQLSGLQRAMELSLFLFSFLITDFCSVFITATDEADPWALFMQQKHFRDETCLASVFITSKFDEDERF